MTIIFYDLFREIENNLGVIESKQSIVNLGTEIVLYINSTYTHILRINDNLIANSIRIYFSSIVLLVYNEIRQ